MGLEVKDVKELMDQVTVYVEMASVAAVGLKAIHGLLAQGSDLSNAELQVLLSENRDIIASNKAKIEATIIRDTK
ncbi:MAG: hypothetical protein COA45_03950 [Zetaproteobacteria bacterium]|nr:MAG: hypothetical protein COA45_03950 [Zetaproteobacteria bacterium]